MVDDNNNSAMPVKQRQKAYRQSKFLFVAACLLAFGLMLSSVTVALPMATAQTDTSEAMTKDEDKKKFELVEATIPGIHNAIKAGDITCTDLVQQCIDRAKAYNGVCTQLVTEDGAPIPPATGKIMADSPTVFPTETVPVSSILPNLDEYAGLPLDLGRMEPTISDPTVQQQFGMIVGIPNAGQVNALGTLNIRGERSVTCKGEFDAHPSTGPLPEGAPEVCEEFRQQPDALERAAELDAQYKNNPDLKNLPMYCIPVALKDVFETKDMRTTAAADVNYAMDAAPKDGKIAAEFRAKGAIIYAKANEAEYNGSIGDPGGAASAAFAYFGESTNLRGTWTGPVCNPYDTERTPRGSSSGSGASVAANLVTIAICEQTGGSCKGPASRSNVVSLLTTKGIMPEGGGIGNQFMIDRAGINARTVSDAVHTLDALKDPNRGYFDPNDIYTALPKSLIPDEPYASFLVDEEDVKDKPLAGMRIGIVREMMVKHSLNDVAISDQINNETKTILRDKLGAELVESFDPLYSDDPDIPNMEYTFQDGLAEVLPRHMPEYFFKTTSSGELEFAVPGHNVTHRDYLANLSESQAPLSDNLNIRRVLSSPPTFSKTLDIAAYLIERGDERVNDWASFNANSKYFRDADRAGSINHENKVDLRSEGLTERMKMSAVMRLVLLKVMYENDIDVFVAPENTIPHNKVGGPTEPTVRGRGAAGATQTFSPLLGIPEIVVPAGYNQIVYEPQFVLSANNTEYRSVTGTEQSLLPVPLPISILFWAGQGDEPALIKVASAYEAATHHRTPPPDFSGLLPTTFPVEHMPAPTASAGYGVYSQKPARAEYITNSSELVGDEIDSITLRMKSVGTINGTAEIGVLNDDLSVKKLFGTLDISTLTPTYTDYEFALTEDELYTIEAGDRIGIKYEGGSLESTSWVSVMLDLEPEDPFDGANSYLQYHYQGAWRSSPDRDLHAVLVQTHE